MELEPPPAGWETTRDALHAVAERVIGPARKAVDGRIRLGWLPGGFGTPRVGDGWQMRVDGAEFVHPDGRRDPIAGADPDAARWLSDYYAFVLAVLEDLRDEVGGDEPVLWPEHFDYAIVAGQANYGGSPGDGDHPEPYLYVGPWEKQEGELWNAPAFGGASLALSELLRAGDPRAAALDFLLARARALAA